MTQRSTTGEGLEIKVYDTFKVFFYFSVMKTTKADSWSDFSQPCEIDLRVMKQRSP